MRAYVNWDEGGNGSYGGNGSNSGNGGSQAAYYETGFQNSGSGAGTGYDRNQEIREAIAVGENALDSLRKAYDALGSARGWGLLDLFGGGMISGLVKHFKLGDAEQALEEAKYWMEAFQDELGDIRDLRNMDISMDGLLTFADFFFDGFLADILVQSKIADGRMKLEEAIHRMESILNRLYKEVQ